MTDKEIIQALRCCQFGEPCASCQAVSNKNCIDDMHKCAADLIERLTAENADLRKEIEWKDMVIALAQKEQAKAEAERDALREKQRWIPVTERLPEEKVNCIVHYKHAYCDTDDYWAIGFCFYDGEKFKFDPVYKVTHWMPLPKAPEDGDT